LFFSFKFNTLWKYHASISTAFSDPAQQAASGRDRDAAFQSIISSYLTMSYENFLAKRIHGRPVAIEYARKKEVK
jgi:hypothetical protein